MIVSRYTVSFILEAYRARRLRCKAAQFGTDIARLSLTCTRSYHAPGITGW
jgi:hypothetical protein